MTDETDVTRNTVTREWFVYLSYRDVEGRPYITRWSAYQDTPEQAADFALEAADFALEGFADLDLAPGWIIIEATVIPQDAAITYAITPIRRPQFQRMQSPISLGTSTNEQ